MSVRSIEPGFSTQRHIILLCFLIIFSSKLLGQIEYAENWCFFQHHKVNFSSGAPVITGTSSLFGWGEGCATISDKNTGQLLFYTDGITVYNRNDVVMQNGTGILGEVSSCQSSLIIPMPGDSLKYYLFTTGEDGGPGLLYSIIDMSLDGGLGAVTAVKNVVLYADAAEKLAATKGCNEEEYWVLCTNEYNNGFCACKITSAGISSPVISAAGSPNGYPRNPGQMKFSPDGKKIAKAYYYRYYNNTTQLFPLGEIFNFDLNTGQVSNAIILDFPGKTVAYGTEFSPNGNFLYCNAGTFTYQFDISYFNAAAINNSRIIIDNNSPWIGSLQLAPDGKIYKVKSGYLDVINNPDSPGTACNFVSNSFYLGGSTSYGLPNFVSSFLVPNAGSPTLNIADLSICKNDTILITAPQGFTNYSWTPGYNIDPVTGANVSVWPLVDTSYVLTATSNNGCRLLDTVSVKLFLSTPVNLGNDTSLCRYETLSLDAGQGFMSYLWNTGESTQNISVHTPGIFNVTATNIFGCKSSDTLALLDIYDLPVIHLQHEINICQGEHFLIDATLANASYTWQDNSTSPVFDAIDSGTYWVNVTVNSCKSSDTVIVSYKDCNCKLIIPNAITPNGDGINDKWILSEGNCFSQFDVYVYNSYGSLVYQKTNYHNEWQGTYNSKNLPDGTYYYIIHATRNNKKQQQFKGNITLLR